MNVSLIVKMTKNIIQSQNIEQIRFKQNNNKKITSQNIVHHQKYQMHIDGYLKFHDRDKKIKNMKLKQDDNNHRQVKH